MLCACSDDQRSVGKPEIRSSNRFGHSNIQASMLFRMSDLDIRACSFTYSLTASCVHEAASPDFVLASVLIDLAPAHARSQSGASNNRLLLVEGFGRE